MIDTLTSADKQNLLYSLVVVTLLAVSLLTRREMGFGQIIKYCAGWAALIMIFVALYAYRFEFGGFKDRMMGAMNPTKARLNEGGQIVIEISEAGHFFIDLKINGVPMRFMIDTGASSIVIDKNQAREIGIDMQNLVFNKRYETANGEVFGAGAVVKEIEVANIKFSDVNVSVNGAELDTPLLGMSFLRRFKKYEFYQDRLILTP